MQDKLSTMQHSGGEVVNQLQAELDAAHLECRNMKAALAELQQTLLYERAKLTSLEATMGNLTAGNEELIAREKAAAEERAAQQREREAQHAEELRATEAQAKSMEQRLKTDMNSLKLEFSRKQDESNDNYDQMKKAKDRDIESLRRLVWAILCTVVHFNPLPFIIYLTFCFSF